LPPKPKQDPEQPNDPEPTVREVAVAGSLGAVTTDTTEVKVEPEKSLSEQMQEELEPLPEPKLEKMTEEEEYANAGITKEEAEKKPQEIADSNIAEEIEEAMKGEGDDLDKWNNWVEAANKEAEKKPENPSVTVQEALELPKEEAIDKEIELPDTQNRIFYTKELEQSDAPKKKGSSYIVKEEGNQIRKKTNPGE
jgi:regulator of protease activity HflC (stomatin/prohibitin superfamily)